MTTATLDDRRIGGPSPVEGLTPVQPTVQPATPQRLDLDAIEARLETIRAEERAEAGIIVRAEPPAPLPAEIQAIKDENERLRRMVLSAIDARSHAREFMTIWSDPRKLPELIQEIYESDSEIAHIRKEINDDAARRAARLKAHIALTYQLHPLIKGMIYSWPDGGAVITEIGWRGYTEMIQRSEHFDLDGPRPMTEDEKVLHGVGPDDRGGVCILYDWKRIDNFTSRGLPAPRPYIGIGVWRKGNQIPKGRSGQWVSEKNSLKDLARKVLSFAVTKTAEANLIDLEYNEELGMWKLPIIKADWLKSPEAEARFVTLLAQHGITDEEFNGFLGHNWHYTELDPVALKIQFDRFLGQRNAIEGVAVVVQTQEPAPEPAKPAEPQQPEVSTDTTATVTSEQPVEAAARITGDEIREIATEFATRHAMDVLQARKQLAELVGLKSLINYTGTVAQLKVVADSWKPEGQLL